MDEFFEELRNKAMADNEYGEYEWVLEHGIDATIEALQEMMIGRPMKAEIQHGTDKMVGPFTEIAFEEHDMAHLMFYDHHGTDGQKVKVCVFGEGKK